MIHAVKILPEYFEAVVNQIKKFEVRKMDRPYNVGDFLALNEYDINCYTGRCCLVKITYVFMDRDMLKGDYAVLSIEPCFIGSHSAPMDPNFAISSTIPVYERGKN